MYWPKIVGRDKQPCVACDTNSLFKSRKRSRDQNTKKKKRKKEYDCAT